MEDKLYTVAEAAAYLDLTLSNVKNHIHRGNLGYAPGTTRLTQATLDQFRQNRRRIHIARQHNYLGSPHPVSYALLFIITNTDDRPLWEIATTLQVGHIREMQSNRARNQKPSYQYHARGVPERRLAELLEPYLRIKREQAHVFLEFPMIGYGNRQPVPPDIEQQRAECYEAI